ncbi:hypothetical protein BDD12DRAFT_335356 [Trichophaea hybrida]|nr:hypothetical protein BDD12DRAFT_335356 [Trichophaea hybrida]
MMTRCLPYLFIVFRSPTAIKLPTYVHAGRMLIRWPLALFVALANHYLQALPNPSDFLAHKIHTLICSGEKHDILKEPTSINKHIRSLPLFQNVPQNPFSRIVERNTNCFPRYQSLIRWVMILSSAICVPDCSFPDTNTSPINPVTRSQKVPRYQIKSCNRDPKWGSNDLWTRDIPREATAIQIYHRLNGAPYSP